MNSKEGEEAVKKKFEEFVERNKFRIGGILLLLIFIGSGYLLYRENYSKVSYDDKISKLENEIAELKKIRISESAPSEEKTEIATSPVETSVSEPETKSAVDSGKVAGTSTKTTESAVIGMVNINTANESALDSLPGIGPTYAQRIIEYRVANGGFKTVEEIKNVKGIGDKTFEKFKDKITVN